MIGLIQQQITLRRQKASALVKHPLLDLFVRRLDLQDQTSRVLGFRELEKSLAQQSELSIGPLRAEIEKLSNRYAEEWTR